MPQQQILPVLYDLSVTIGGEIKLKSLLTRTLQRLLYHTSFSAGLVCLDLPTQSSKSAMVQTRINAAVGDFELIAQIERTVLLPSEMLYGTAEHSTGQTELLGALGTTRSHYRSFFRLPLENSGVIIMLAIEPPETHFKLDQVLQPVLAQLARAIVLCRTYDQQQRAALAAQARLQQSLLQIESQYKALIELSPMGVCMSSDGTIFDCNESFLALFGYDHLDELRGKPFVECIAPQLQAGFSERIRLRTMGLAPENFYESTGQRRDGSQFPFMVSAKRVMTEQGPRTFSYFVDMTEQKHTEQELRSVNHMMRQVLETAPLRIFWKDQDSRYLGCNLAFARDAGFSSPQDVVGKLDSDMGWGKEAESYRADDLQVIQNHSPRLNYEEPQTTPDGHQIWLRTSKVPLVIDTGEKIGVLGVYDDITAQKQAQEKIHQLAHYDSLTGLANRTLLQDALEKVMVTSARSHKYGAILFLDLDDFKSFNDTQGPAIGDELLKEVGVRLSACVHKTGMAARSGGDLFIVLLEKLSTSAADSATQAEAMAERMRGKLASPFDLGPTQASITASIGIVLFSGQSSSADTILKHADTALNEAKFAGRNATRFFDPAMQKELEARIGLVSDLSQAVAEKQLHLYFQKQVNSQGYTTGAEVLLRWLHPERGLVSPAQFIGLAEETGIIIPMGLWVLQEACHVLKSWQAMPALREMTLAVNVSARQFHQSNFVEQVRNVLVQSGAKPALLKLELTESVVLEHTEDTIAKMRELKLMGISFSMDDFGTGYSSLQYLKRLPIDQLKIDQGFVRDITTDSNDAAIVQTIIAMTDALGLNVIAEGVETRDQQAFLEQRGCHNFQGYLFGKPMPLPQFQENICN